MQMDQTFIAESHLHAISTLLSVRARARESDRAHRRNRKPGVTHRVSVRYECAATGAGRCVYFKSSWLIKVATANAGYILSRRSCTEGLSLEGSGAVAGQICSH